MSLLSTEICTEIDRWLEKYPPNQKQSAVISALHTVQNYHGWISRELLDAVAEYLEMPNIAVYEVASFYSMFDLKEVGRYKINICTNISCLLSGAEEMVEYIEKRLGIRVGQTTADGKFTLRSVECLAACVSAPVCEINRDYHERLTPDKIDAILKELE
ncbi:MAG: NADH-quinone oxidoreductase subunit NuoE [Gammaproteobacteria bacterium]|nr:NADH-quinone oxidoreductase subunit NuoE [Gammaproteobacteria bacterium]MCD8543195.1 NADH-quinone oxidoreductase subunit NuoE [Gammaproteobacteria bacterium]